MYSLSVDCYCNNVLLASAECHESLAICAGHFGGCGVGVKGRWGSAAQCRESGQGEVYIHRSSVASACILGGSKDWNLLSDHKSVVV